MAIELTKCWSTAWSFQHDGPIEEEVPFKIFLQPEELKKFYEAIKFDALSLDAQESWEKVIHPKAHRHLGLTANLRGITTESSTKTIGKMNDRLTQLKLKNMNLAAQRKCSNMLISTMHSFVPLQANYDHKELERLDMSIASTIMKKNGISDSDCKHRIFIPEKLGGLGFQSSVEVDLIAIAREIEITSNGPGLDCRTYRARLAAILGYEDPESDNVVNHALQSVRKLSKYGIFFRDSKDDLINDILRYLVEKEGKRSVGDPLFRNGSGPTLGDGNATFIKFAFGHQIHVFLRELQSNNWTPNAGLLLTCKECNLDMENILEIRKKLGTIRFEKMTDFFGFSEWNNVNSTVFAMNIDTNPTTWIQHSISENHTLSASKAKWEWSYTDIVTLAKSKLKINWSKYVISHPIKENINTIENYTTYGKVLNFLHTRDSPLIIATDGSHQTPKTISTKPITSASFVICSLDIRPNETLESGEWANRPTIPLLCRSAILPAEIGTSSSDIAHGESFAFAMQELAMDATLPRIIIMDSEAVRNQMINIREKETAEADRSFIRTIAGGISKSIISLIAPNLENLKEPDVTPPTGKDSTQSWLQSTFADRNKRFLTVAKSWVQEEITNKRMIHMNFFGTKNTLIPI